MSEKEQLCIFVSHAFDILTNIPIIWIIIAIIVTVLIFVFWIEPQIGTRSDS